MAPRRSTTSFMSKRSFNTNSNLSLLLKNYMIPTIRVEQDVQAVARNLERKVGLAPLFYQNAPVILDFEASEGISKERKIEREGDKEKNQQKVRNLIIFSGALESNKIVALFNDIYKLNLIPVGITFTNDPIIQVRLSFSLISFLLFHPLHTHHSPSYLLGSTLLFLIFFHSAYPLIGSRQAIQHTFHQLYTAYCSTILPERRTTFTLSSPPIFSHIFPYAPQLAPET